MKVINTTVKLCTYPDDTKMPKIEILTNELMLKRNTTSVIRHLQNKKKSIDVSSESFTKIQAFNQSMKYLKEGTIWLGWLREDQFWWGPQLSLAHILFSILFSSKREQISISISQTEYPILVQRVVP
jgi:hypothetical protein